VEISTLAEACNICGAQQMRVRCKEITFLSHQTNQINYTFQQAWIRRWGSRSGRFYFEVGRRCPKGEGQIICYLENPKEVSLFVQAVIHSGK